MPIFINGNLVFVGPGGGGIGGGVSGDFKESVRLASTGNLGLTGLADIDGVTPVANDRILVKDQTVPADNGIYLAASGAWARAADFDEDAEVTTGATTFVSEGTANDGDGYTLVTPDPIVVGTTALTFVKSFGSSLVPHAVTHVSTGSDPIAGATITVGGLMSAADKIKFDAIEPLAKDDQDADEVPFDNTTSGLTATDVQEAIDEVEARVDVNDAKVSAAGLVTTHSDVSSAGSGAIISVAERSKLAAIEAAATADQSAAEVPYSNASSGLTATDVQAAIDEVEGRVDTNDAKVSADGLVTTHSDVTSAGSGAIITVAERANLPTTAQKAALAGTGTPGAGDPYVSDSDARMSDARTPTAHAASHVTGGGDIIDGDILNITFVPSNYTRSTAPTEVTSILELTAHLKGIDDELGTMGTGDVVGPGTATNTAVVLYDGTTGKLIKNSVVTIDGSGNIATAGTMDGRDVSVDGSTLDGHLDGGASKHDATEIDYERADGSKKNIQATSDEVENALTDLDDAIGALVTSPTNYTPTAATVTGHQAGIDTALGLRALDTDVTKKDGSVAFTGDQSMGTNKLTSLSPGTAGTDAVNKNQLDAVSAGLDPKASVRVATIAILDDNTDISGAPSYNNVGGTEAKGQITATLAVSGVFAIDGVTMVNGNRVLVKHEGDGSGLGGDANGIYTVTISGTSLTLDRATDFDSDAEVTAGAFMFTEEGATHGDTGWVLITNDPLTIGTASGTALAFTQFSSLAALSAGDGIDITSNVISVVVADLVGAGIEDDGANNFRIAATAAGAGLTGGGGSALAVNAGAGLEIVSDAVRIATAAAGSGLGGGGGAALVVNTGVGLEIVSDAVRIAAQGDGLTGGGGSVLAVDSSVERTANKNAASGYAGLSAGSKLTGSQQVYGTASNTAAQGNDARILTQGENDAAVGTDGTPSTSNKFVTNSDARNTNSRTPTAHASDHQNGGGDEVATATPAANAIPKAGAGSELDAGWLPDSVREETFTWNINGSVSTGIAIDGHRVMRRDGTIVGITMSLGSRGNNGNVIVDINKHVPAKPITDQRNNTTGVTVYTTQGNRPTLAGDSGTSGDNAVIEAVAPDVTSFLAGDFLSMDVDSSVVNDMDLDLDVHVQYS